MATAAIGVPAELLRHNIGRGMHNGVLLFCTFKQSTLYCSNLHISCYIDECEMKALKPK